MEIEGTCTAMCRASHEMKSVLYMCVWNRIGEENKNRFKAIKSMRKQENAHRQEDDTDEVFDG